MAIKVEKAAASNEVGAPEWLESADFVPYPEAIAFMEAYVADMVKGEKGEAAWFLEHGACYTAGVSSLPDEVVGKPDLPVFETGRGGHYTYHGPGQRVIYVMSDLRKRDLDVHAHVARLEEWTIRVLAQLGIKGERREGRIGVWVVTPADRRASDKDQAERKIFLPQKEEKISAIGVRVRRGIAFHGLALNVAPDLSAFRGIIPCGIREYGVTSLAALGVQASMAEIDKLYREKWNEVFG